MTPLSDFIPISEAVAIVARHRVTDPEDDAVARAFTEPEIGEAARHRPVLWRRWRVHGPAQSGL